MVRKIYFLIFILSYYNLQAQNILLDEINFMDTIRVNDLINTNNFKNTSFFTRSSSKLNSLTKSKIFNFNYNYQFNNLTPMGFNDGSFVSARGKQERFIVGTNFKIFNFEVKFEPEFLTIQNTPQEYFTGYTSDGNWWTKYYYNVANNIDDFRSFGNEELKLYNLGQSRAGFINNQILFGFSNENIWWGPGIRNSLIFTNNSPGFKHLYLSNNKEIRTKIGFFEFNYIRGKIENDNYTNPDNGIMNSIWDGAILPKIKKDRYIQAININFQPKIFPNFYLGYSLSKMKYLSDFSYSDIFYKPSENNKNIIVQSIYLKYKLPNDHAEIYSEIGQQDLLKFPTNLFSDSSKATFIIGVRKIFIVNNNSYFEFNFELSQLSIMNPRIIFKPYDQNGIVNNKIFYTSENIRQGYTNQSQLLGASIGPGSNSQTLLLNYKNKKLKLGIIAERVIKNEDFYHNVYVNGIFGNSKADAHWVDLNLGLNLTYNFFNKLIISSSIMNTKSMNYRWLKNGNDDLYAVPGINSDKYNLQSNLSLKYTL
jgi:hypothetical protein